jgi:hypothetical protein
MSHSQTRDNKPILRLPIRYYQIARLYREQVLSASSQDFIGAAMKVDTTWIGQGKNG